MANVEAETSSEAHLAQIEALEERMKLVQDHEWSTNRKLKKHMPKPLNKETWKWANDLVLKVADYVRKVLSAPTNYAYLIKDHLESEKPMIVVIISSPPMKDRSSTTL